MYGIFKNITGYFIIRPLVADDVFVIIALPKAGMERCPTILFHPMDIAVGGDGFECAHNFPQCRMNTVGAPLVGARIHIIRHLSGTHKGCPYGIVHIGYANDAMEMIGHYHIFMTDNMGIFIGQLSKMNLGTDYTD